LPRPKHGRDLTSPAASVTCDPQGSQLIWQKFVWPPGCYVRTYVRSFVRSIRSDHVQDGIILPDNSTATSGWQNDGGRMTRNLFLRSSLRPPCQVNGQNPNVQNSTMPGNHDANPVSSIPILDLFRISDFGFSGRRIVRVVHPVEAYGVVGTQMATPTCWLGPPLHLHPPSGRVEPQRGEGRATYPP